MTPPTPHLDEQSLEALATDREDLVGEEMLAHLDECEQCAEWVALERESANDASVALRRALPELDELDAMVARAMEKAPEAIAPSRRSLWLGAGLGGLAATALAILSLPGAGSLGGLSAAGGQILTLARAADRVVDSSVPGGWGLVALVGLALALVLIVPMRFFLDAKPFRPSGPITGTLGALLLGTLSLGALWLPTSLAHAYRVDGAWPDPQPRVSVDVEHQPTSEALRQAAQSAGLGVVVRLPDDPAVTLHVTDAPIGEVIEALLGQSDVVVRPGPSLITVRVDDAPLEAAAVEPGPVEPGPVPRAVAVDSPHVTPIPLAHGVPIPAPSAIDRELPRPPPGGVSDRVTFGADVVIGPDESVRGVYTMGGDATLRGRAFGDVVTMGGDAEIEGEVIGNVTTMGGDISLGDGARINGDLNAMGGDIELADGAVVHGQILSAPDSASRANARRMRGDGDHAPTPGVFRWALWNVMIFLLGLLLMGTSRKRLSNLRGELASRPLRSAFGGFFGLLAGGVLTLVLALTIIGIPGSFVLGTMLFVGCWLGLTTSAWWLGSVLPIPWLADRPVLQLVVGVAVLFLVGLVPTLGNLLVSGAALAGLGAVIATGFGNQAPHAPKRRHVATGPFRTSA